MLDGCLWDTKLLELFITIIRSKVYVRQELGGYKRKAFHKNKRSEREKEKRSMN
jgi:hypothetical protein